MAQRLRGYGVVCLATVCMVGWISRSEAISLDSDGDIKFGARTYVNARVGTENTHDGVPLAPDPSISTTATFPHSNAGHLRQNRFFLELELNHSLGRLVKEGVGPL